MRVSSFAAATLIAGLSGILGCQRAAPAYDAAALPSAQCRERASYSEQGLASWYGSRHNGRRTASGQSFSMGAMTAAHRKLPMGTKVRVTNLENGRKATVTINDRGPYRRGRVLDVSKEGAEVLGFKNDGVTPVRLEVVEGC